MRMSVLLVAVPSLALAQGRAASPVPQYPIEDFLASTIFSGASFSPDNRKILVSSDQSGVFNVYTITVQNGASERLTHSTADAIFGLSYFPRDARILYASDRAGNELTHIYVRSPDGSVRDLTPGDSLKAQFAGWARDLRSFFLLTNERDRRFFDLYEVNPESYERTVLYRNEAGLDVGDVSPDRRRLALVKSNTTNDSDVFLYDRETGETTKLTAHQGDVQNFGPEFTPDGRALDFLTNEGHEFQYLVRHDLATGERRVIHKFDWDILFTSFSRTGKYLAVAVNEDARTDVRLYEAATMQPIPLPNLPEGDITGLAFSRDETHLAFYVSGSRFPRDLYAMRIGTDGAATAPPRRLTRALSPRINPEHLVDGQVVRFASYDGLQIPGILYRPHGASSQRRAPALVQVHGGPGGQARVGYRADIQYLVNHGYTVFDINNRGSSGYGKTFYALDDRRHGEADLGDVVASKRMLIETGVVDAERIGIIGGSYGGYMVLAALTLQPDAFRTGVDLFGISNWLRTLRSTPPWWESFRRALYTEMGDPGTDDSLRLRRISPLVNAHAIRAPLMVLQGANDPRVLQVESDEIVAAARANGVPVEYIVFSDEGHGFVKKQNRIRGYRAILEFLDRHLKGQVGAR